MFALDNQRCVINSVNPHAENTEDKAIVCEIALSADVSCDLLEDISRGMKQSFYEMPTIKSLTLSETPADIPAPRLRHENLFKPFQLRKESAGYAAEIVWGDLASTVKIQLTDCKLYRFVLDPKQGGTCALSLLVQAHPDTHTMGELCALIGREVIVTLHSPALFAIENSATHETEDV